MTISLHPMEPFGAEITGVTGGELTDPAAAQEYRAVLDEHGVLIYRDLHISDEDLVTFTRSLGEPVLAKTREHRLGEIETITLDPTKTNAVLASYRKGNFHWHIDGATLETPQWATLLTAREVDTAGGDTQFANTFLAYAALPEDEKRQLEGLTVRHTFAAAQLLANPEPTEADRAGWARVPARIHPLVWTRRNGRKSLLIGATAEQVVGMPADESRALLNRLLEWATRPQFTYQHRWHRGDLVIWDNTGMLHRAIPFEPTSRRLMHRTTLSGVEAVA
ncbi:TauD/TfdA dioxygenase family protein [Nocardia macrotermitis]|uniref:Alpha-ketoglutarate-dependent 2,4-dichlorophenoxyacetate dioxygenase n=1 Tax=Nocardia macrotermitis TaxID=2585198 RepID=A0A7K0D6Q6_9NOCA|nr:TauD/TfdA family dioxygenase [Nocardia macrotermitis]MQY21436.1 Alpha-ketoglutarate-dependent 2,4-dichlorophenoxyacetate dioxygenase [Nocardia macrotermitis]